MADFIPKINWQPDDPVTEGDFNRIEQGIADAHGKADNLKTQITEGTIKASSAEDADKLGGKLPEHYAKQDDLTTHKAETMQYGPIEVTVGENGDYQTINEALEYLSKKYPSYVEGEDKTKAVIKLLSGFEMKEQVIVEVLNLSWIELISEDEEVPIIREELTKEVTLPDGTNIFPAFAATDGGFLFIFHCLFHMDETGEEDNRKGIACVRNSRALILEGAGMIGAHDNIYAHSTSTIEAYGAIAIDAIRHGIAAYQSSTIDAESANVSGAGSNGIYATRASTINAHNADASGAGSNGIYATQASTIHAWGADASGAGSNGIYASQISTINATAVNARKGTSDSPDDIRCSTGSFIRIYDNPSSANRTIGGTSQTINELTSDGIIFG